jgi:predicted transcriptional regulator
MTKNHAIELFGGSVGSLAKALGVTPQAIYQWPDELPQAQADRVMGAAIRVGRTLDPASVLKTEAA